MVKSNKIEKSWWTDSRISATRMSPGVTHEVTEKGNP